MAGWPPTVRRIRSTLSGPWGVVLGVGLLITAANCYYIVPASILPVLMTELSLSPTTASLLVSVMFGTQMVTNVPIGIVLDRVDNRRAIAAATVVLVLTYAWSYQAALNGNFIALIASRAVAAAGTAVTWTAGANVVGRVFDAENQATAVGVLSATPAAGFALGLLTGPLVVGQLGWSTVFVVYAVPVVLGGVAFLAAASRTDVSGDGASTPNVGDFRDLLTGRAIWSVAGMAFLGFSLYAFLTSWMPTYLTEELGLSLASGGLFAALFPAIGVLARGSSGAVSDRFFDHRRRPVSLLAFVVALPALAFILFTGAAAVVGLALVVGGFFVQLGMGLFYAQSRELADPNVAATGVAFATSMATFGGFTAPLVAGFLIEQTGGYSAAFGYAGIVAVVGIALAWITPEPDVGTDA